MNPFIFYPDETSWKEQLKTAVTNTAELLRLLELNPETVPHLTSEQIDFSLKVPRGFIACMKPGDPNDPLLKQVLIQPQEKIHTPGYTQDPLNEKQFNPVPGLLHKYHNRALLMITGACAIHCRYCFRRHFPYEDNIPGTPGLTAIVDYIQQHPEINEIILSSGDPMSAPDRILKTWCQALDQLPQLKYLRIHSRTLAVLPERWTQDFVDLLNALRVQPVIILHINHPNELSPSLRSILKAVRSTRIQLFNHSVLLAGVNDDPHILKNLSESLFECGVIPYYLNILDPVAGAAHFYVEEARIASIYHELASQISGYLLPRLVQELAHKPYKTPKTIL